MVKSGLHAVRVFNCSALLEGRRGVPVFWEPQSGRKQSLTTPTSLYNGMSVVIIKLSAY